MGHAVAALSAASGRTVTWADVMDPEEALHVRAAFQSNVQEALMDAFGNGVLMAEMDSYALRLLQAACDACQAGGYVTAPDAPLLARATPPAPAAPIPPCDFKMHIPAYVTSWWGGGEGHGDGGGEGCSGSAGGGEGH